MKDVWGHSGSMDQSLSELEIRHRTLAREAAVEGIVLLKNEGVLPLSTASAIALLGSGAEKTIKGGIGSGDVNNRENISIYQGMKEAGVTITSEDWLEDYEERYKNARNVWKEKILEDAKHVDNPFDAYASNPFILPEGRAVEAKDIVDAKAAVYVLSRISGEGKDRRRVKGDYYLSEREAADLFFLNEKKIPVILLLNAGGPIELTDILENTENIKAILNISQPGQESGYAVADILLGNCVPSAKLTTTVQSSLFSCRHFRLLFFLFLFRHSTPERSDILHTPFCLDWKCEPQISFLQIPDRVMHFLLYQTVLP